MISSQTIVHSHSFVWKRSY